MIKMANTKASVDIFVEENSIYIDFADVSLPEHLQRRLDVSDFVTPVQSIDAQSNKAGARFALNIDGEFDYLAYQTDSEYRVNVKPLTDEDIELNRKQLTDVSNAYVGNKLSLNFQDIEVRAALQLIADLLILTLSLVIPY